MSIKWVNKSNRSILKSIVEGIESHKWQSIKREGWKWNTSSRSDGKEKERLVYPTTLARDGEEPVEYDNVMKSSKGK